ncbi:hypothetical protein JOQ06_021240 [Pogonophryne albipinna]|uniref:Uncharacterized protein n=1 Tax=Pogonophryne albipinna TaxID=1090488 RepID=A0AAD6F5D6_9TELE|nr:hypothetical protein JOQ06_021240 [Pogonophryne albipinna]
MRFALPQQAFKKDVRITIDIFCTHQAHNTPTLQGAVEKRQWKKEKLLKPQTAEVADLGVLEEISRTIVAVNESQLQPLGLNRVSCSSDDSCTSACSNHRKRGKSPFVQTRLLHSSQSLSEL